MRSTLTHALAAAAAVTLWTGCGGDGTAPEQFDARGSVRFSYQGSRSGTYDASGDLAVLPAAVATFVGGAPGETPVPGAPGAGALRQGTQLVVVAYHPTTAPRGDLFVLFAGDVTGKGELEINPLACASSSSSSIGLCRSGALFPDLDPGTLGDGSTAPEDLIGRIYALASGKITITSLSGLRVRGTFQGVAVRASSGSGLPFDALTITGGTFDVPIRVQ